MAIELPDAASRRSLSSLLAALLLLSGAAASASPAIFGESAMVKVRPSHPGRKDSGVGLTAARNEFVSFQVVVHGGDTGAKGIRAAVVPLQGPTTLGPSQFTLYRQAHLTLNQSSGGMGEKGVWPDALVPDQDEVEGEARKAFPFDVPAQQARAVWVDLLVPESAPPGVYRGAVRVTGEGGLDVQVPVTLSVVDVTLPSTASLPSAFLIFSGNVCLAHTGDAECGGNSRVAADLLGRYQRLALDHRLTLTNFFVLPQGGDWKAFDAEYTPYMEGHAKTRLRGAKMTSAQYVGPRETTRLQAFTRHFKEKGWLDRAFDYTGDEPPYGISFAEALSRAQSVRAAAPELRTLLTTTYGAAKEYGLTSFIDILAPVVNHLEGSKPPYDASARPGYESFLKEDGRRRLWVYQSCMSQGCAYGTNMPENTASGGWPSYMVDRSAAKNRAMQWVAFVQRAAGELYYETAMALPTAWSDQFRFNGNGDGTLFYPGTPDAIGGKTQVPVPSIRLKHARQGMQDYEWLKLVADAGDGAYAYDTARSLVPAAYKVGDDGAAFDRARLRLIARYLELQGKRIPDPNAPGAPPAVAQIPGSEDFDPITGEHRGDTGSAGGFGSGARGASCSSSGGGLTGTLSLLVAMAALLWLGGRRRSAPVRVRVRGSSCSRSGPPEGR